MQLLDIFSLLRLSGDQLAKFHSRVQNTNYICSSISQYLHYPFVIIVLCPGGSVEVLFKEEDKGVVVFLKEGEGKCAAVAAAVAVVALFRAVAVAMCARVMWRNQPNNWTRTLTTTTLVR